MHSRHRNPALARALQLEDNRMSSRLLIGMAMLAIAASVVPASASNGKVAFSSGRNGTNGIWVMNPDGTAATSLISDVSHNFNDPVWSPDGTKIAFTSNQSANGVTEIYVMSADGTNVTRLTNDA